MSNYISKDFVHYGCGLTLNPDIVWNCIPYSVQKNIKKAKRENVTVKQVAGTIEDIVILREMWYDYNDPNMPVSLNEDEFMFIAYNNKQVPVGAVIVLPVGNHLFLNNLAGNPEGKSYGVQDFLLWFIVNHFKESEFKYLDVGVSYRQNLYNFFKKWKIFSYPVIFNKPKMNVKINVNPFINDNYDYFSDIEQENQAIAKLKLLFKTEEITFVPDIVFAQNIIENLNYEFVENTFDFSSNSSQICAIDLTKLFPVQFGSLILNANIPDTDMWNKYHCLDVFKRTLVFSLLNNELDNFENNLQSRENNYKKLEQYFEIEDVKPLNLNQNIKNLFYFEHDLNQRYHNKLSEFEIEHYFDAQSNIIGLPIHQNLKDSLMELIYAVFRGVLNLCSEWEHTDNYKEIK